jgi:prepilin-type N-terminal cleavage/methylation domain-containing protein
MRRASSQSGFSLVELIVSMAVLLIVMAAAFNILDRCLTSFDTNQILSEAHANSDFAVIRITEILRGAGANPGALTSVSTGYLTSTSQTVGTTTYTNSIITLKSDLNGNGVLTDRVAASGSLSFIISSEDLELRFVPPGGATIYGVTVPGNTIVQIDNTPNPAGQTGYHIPVVLAQNITGFSCQLFPTGTANPKEALLSITAGPSRTMLPTNPRYRTFTTSVRVKLRNR